MTRKKIFFVWLFGNVLLMLISSCISMLIWDYTYMQEENVNWRPIDDMPGMIYLFPISLLIPWGWASIVVMAISVYKKQPLLLLGSAVIAIISGALWPKQFVMMMGV